MYSKNEIEDRMKAGLLKKVLVTEEEYREFSSYIETNQELPNGVYFNKDREIFRLKEADVSDMVLIKYEVDRLADQITTVKIMLGVILFFVVLPYVISLISQFR